LATPNMRIRPFKAIAVSITYACIYGRILNFLLDPPDISVEKGER